MTNPFEQDKFEERFVAFVDILGFRELVKQSVTDQKLYNTLVKALNEMNIIRPDADEATGLLATTFSDNILLSADDTLYGIEHLIFSIDYLANALLDEGILVRGAISRGLIKHTPNMAFGPALVEAVDFESRIAVHPRVIFAKSAVRQIAKWTEPKVLEAALTKRVWNIYNSRMIQDNDDGVYFVHILNRLEAFSGQTETVGDVTGHPLSKRIQSLSKWLQDELDGTIANPRVYEKLKWLAKYWNERVRAGAISRIRFPAERRKGIVLPWQNSLGNQRDDDARIIDSKSEQDD